ncbi:MAG: toprim domain-containing protein [Candidatus Bathyarchaeota archaeon]|nr:toprim domain-containing protein [Candidatus Bathyarchaeota archaeon]
MSTHQKEKQERIQKIIDKLIEASEKGKPVIVEGKKDNQALKELGVNGVILTVKSGGKSFLEATREIEMLGAKEVILLLDFDRRGREGTKRLQQNLERAKVKVNLRFWSELKGLISRDIQCIESLPSYLSSAQRKVT